MSAHAFAKGQLDALERRDQADVSANRFQQLVATMRELGFSEREAPFAASPRDARGPTTVARMREHLQVAYPFLYRDEGEL
jgi:hypothetical protein